MTDHFHAGRLDQASLPGAQVVPTDRSGSTIDPFDIPDTEENHTP